MNSPETPHPKSFEEVSTLLRDKRISYSELPEILAQLRNPRETPTSYAPSVSPSVTKPIETQGAWSERFFAATKRTSERSGALPPHSPTPPPSAAKPDSLRSQLAALDESLKREQRYRQQFEEASAKASLAEALQLELESSKEDLKTAKARESELQSQIGHLQLQVTRSQRDIEALGAMKAALLDAQTRVNEFSSRLKEAELRGALAAHLEEELARARAELADAKARENRAELLVQNTQIAESNFAHLRAELESSQQALADATNREETLQIQLAEAHGAISIARQIESELDRHKIELNAALDRIVALNADLAAARANTENSGEPARSAAESATKLRNQELLAELAVLQSARADAEAEIRELHAAASIANEEIQRQALASQSIQSRLAETEDGLVRAKAENVSLIQQLTKNTEDTGRQIAELSRELAELRSQATRLPELESEVARVHAELSRALEREKDHERDAHALISARQHISEIDTALAISQTELVAARQSGRILETQLQAASESAARVETLQLEASQIRDQHTASLALVEKLQQSLAEAQEAANHAQSLRAEISAQLIRLREADVLRQRLEARVSELEDEAARNFKHSESREAELRSEVDRLTASENATRSEIIGYQHQLDQLQATITELEQATSEQRADTARQTSELKSELERAIGSHANEVSQLHERLATLTSEATAEAETLREKLAHAETVERQLRSDIERIRDEHAQISDQSLKRIEDFERSIAETRAASEAMEERHSAELTSLKSETAAELSAVRAVLADRESRIAALTEQLVGAGSDAEKVPGLVQEISELREKLEQSKIHEGELTAKLAAIERAAIDITTLMPKVSYGPDYKIRQYSGANRSGHPVPSKVNGPYSAPRLLQWIGRRPIHTLVILSMLLVCGAAGFYFLYQPSYQGVVDAPVRLILSPVTGTVLTAEGESGMSVIKNQTLFTIKNANDGRELVSEAKAQTATFEEEIAYLKSLRASLLQRQINQRIPDTSTWMSEASASFTRRNDTASDGEPAPPDFGAIPSEDYLALRISDTNTKLAEAEAKLEESMLTLAGAEEAFRKNEKADVKSPSTGAIQTMRVTAGTPVEVNSPLAEVVSSEEAFIEAALPGNLADSEVGRKVSIVLEGSTRVLEGEVVAAGRKSGWNSEQTAVSLNNVKPGYFIADIWIAQRDWIENAGFASQIGRKAKVTLK